MRVAVRQPVKIPRAFHCLLSISRPSTRRTLAIRASALGQEHIDTVHVLDPGVSVQCNTVCEGGCRFMAAWVMEEEKASEDRQSKKAKEADKD